MDRKEFLEKQAAMFQALPRIFDVYLDAGRAPEPEVFAAFAALFECTADEFRSMFARYARARGGKPVLAPGQTQDRSESTGLSRSAA